MTYPKKVHFTTIEIIELPYTLGDNPSVSGGVPVAASWHAQKQTVLNLDFFEHYRPDRRAKKDLYLTKDARRELMLQSGYTPEEIVAATREATKVRQERYETLNDLRRKLKALMMQSSQRSPEGSPSRSEPQRPTRQQQLLPPSPIIPRRSPARMEENSSRYSSDSHRHALTYLRFPNHQEGILSPRVEAPRRDGRKRQSHSSMSIRSRLLDSPYPKPSRRIKSPAEKDHSMLIPQHNELFYSPPNHYYYYHHPVQMWSPVPDTCPLLPPQRFASPPPSMLSQWSPPPSRTY